MTPRNVNVARRAVQALLLAAVCGMAGATVATDAPPADSDAMLADIAAGERILSYDSRVDIRPDGALEVTERIRVRAEGRDIRRGIYRDVPTRYRDRHGNLVVVDFEVTGVQRNGRDEPYFTERRGNGVRLNTGSETPLAVPADYTYTLQYRTSRQLGFFASHDELYWNAIGHGWVLPIDGGTVDVRLPAPVAVGDIAVDGYSGPEGARGRGFGGRVVAPGVARWTLTAPLAPGEGLTVVMSFPKGVVLAPTRGQRIGWLLHDNRGLLVALGGLLVLLAYCAQRWRAVGRDPAPGIVITRYEPPPGVSPGTLRCLVRMGHDQRAFSADLLASAVDGAVDITRAGPAGDDWTLSRSRGTTSTVEQRVALEALFADADVVTLDTAAGPRLRDALARHAAGLEARCQPALFQRNGRSAAVAAMIAVVASAAAVVWGLGTGTGLLYAGPVIGLMLLLAGMFAWLVKAPTAEGRRLLDEIAGLRSYLDVADRDDLARLPGPGDPPTVDAPRFARLLPYAVALDVEDAWTARFTRSVGAAAADAAIATLPWYHAGTATSADGAAGFARALGSAFTTSIAASATPPGSSSGSSGGGFSGGGGGGGGGGGR